MKEQTSKARTIKLNTSEFYAPLKQVCTLPEFPLYPKFLNLPLTQEKNYKYSLTSIELNRTPQIYVNFLLDQKINLVNSSAYDLPTSPSPVSKEDEFLLESAEPESGIPFSHCNL